MWPFTQIVEFNKSKIKAASKVVELNTTLSETIIGLSVNNEIRADDYNTRLLPIMHRHSDAIQDYSKFIGLRGTLNCLAAMVGARKI